MSDDNRALEEDGKILDRISAFSDAVFAIAITLLILDLKIPADTLKSNIGSALIALWPNYIAFVVSFFVIGLYWSEHVRLFREMIRYDQNLIWLNLLHLLFIVMIPFLTSIISLYLTPLPVIVYAASIACAGYIRTGIRVYAGHEHRLISEKYCSLHIKKGIRSSLIAPIFFTISIGIALLNPLAAQLLWILMFFFHVIFQQLMKGKEM